MERESAPNRIIEKIKYFKIDLLARLILGFAFIYASIDKIIDPTLFSDTIDNYHITPKSLNNVIALVIPFVELILGLCLILGIYLRGATTLVAILLIWFIFIISQALFRGIDLHCGCFDLAQKNVDVNVRLEMIKRIIEDFVFLILAFVLKLTNKTQWKLK